MQSKTMNRAVLLMPLFLMNGMVVFIRPVNLLGIIVMNVTAIAVMLAWLRLLRKRPGT